MRLLLQVFLHELHHLLGNGLHAGLTGVTQLLVDVVQFDEGQTVVSADDAHRLGMLGLEVGVENEVNASQRI